VTVYVDTSALLKRYVDESDSDRFVALLDADPSWASGWHTLVEVRRNLAARLAPPDRAAARLAFEREWERMARVQLIPSLCREAADLAEATRARTLDALHLAAARRVGGPLVTADLKQAVAARQLGLVVLGA